MADKTIDQLSELTSLDTGDFLVAYDISEPGTEKIKRITKTNAFAGVSGGVTTEQLTTTSGVLNDKISTKFNSAGGNISGNVCVGTNPIGYYFELSGLNKTLSNNSYSSTYSNYQGAPYLQLFKSHSNTIGTFSTTQSGETLGYLIFRGVSTNNLPAAAASIYVSQTGAAGSDEWQIPSQMTFEFGTSGSVLAGMVLSANSTTIRYLGGTGNRAVYSTSTGVLTNTASDQSLKKNIEPLTYGLSEVLKMNPIKFNWIPEDLGQQKEIGFVAQEMEIIVPEVVGTNTDGMKSLDYPKLVAVLCKAIQELEARLVAAGL